MSLRRTEFHVGDYATTCQHCDVRDAVVWEIHQCATMARVAEEEPMVELAARASLTVPKVVAFFVNMSVPQSVNHSAEAHAIDLVEENLEKQHRLPTVCHLAHYLVWFLVLDSDRQPASVFITLKHDVTLSATSEVPRATLHLDVESRRTHGLAVVVVEEALRPCRCAVSRGAV